MVSLPNFNQISYLPPDGTSSCLLKAAKKSANVRSSAAAMRNGQSVIARATMPERSRSGKKRRLQKILTATRTKRPVWLSCASLLLLLLRFFLFNVFSNWIKMADIDLSSFFSFVFLFFKEKLDSMLLCLPSLSPSHYVWISTSGA